MFTGVLLTIVDVMWALDSYSHQEKISSYLSQLQDLDPLRTKYYADMSKFQAGFEVILNS